MTNTTTNYNDEIVDELAMLLCEDEDEENDEDELVELSNDIALLLSEVETVVSNETETVSNNEEDIDNLIKEVIEEIENETIENKELEIIENKTVVVINKTENIEKGIVVTKKQSLLKRLANKVIVSGITLVVLTGLITIANTLI